MARNTGFIRGVIAVGLAIAAIWIAVSPVAIASAGDWSEYMGDSGKSGFNPSETAITPTSASKLAVAWKATSGDSISTQAITSNGLVYWGSWDGYERATSASSGALVWKRYLGRTAECDPRYMAGVASTPKVATVWVHGTERHILWLGGGSHARVYALDADTGDVIWRTQLSSEPGAYVWSSPTLYHGSIYIGLSSFSDCPLVRAGLFELNAFTGKIQHVFWTDPPGCNGNSIWGSPTIDYVTGYVYFVTGNPGSCSNSNQPSPYGAALIAVTASNLQLIGYWRVPSSQQIQDDDFGSTPTLFNARIAGTERYLIGVANKNGLYYAFDRYSFAGGPIWKDQIATAGPPDGGYGSISPSAWDGKTLYVAGGMTKIDGKTCIGSLRAVNPATGAYLWSNCINTGQRYGAVLGGVMAVPGVVAVAAGLELRLVSAGTGATLFTWLDSSIFYSAATISNGSLYIGDTNGTLVAFARGTKRASSLAGALEPDRRL